MDPDKLRVYLFHFPQVTEETPFDEVTAVYKTAGKMFAITNWSESPLRINLKCDPDKALELRDQHSGVEPGYHMNKKHWNTVTVDSRIEEDLLQEWISHSFEEVVKKFPRQKRTEIFEEYENGVTSNLDQQDIGDLRRKI